MPRVESDFVAILETLSRSGVEFIVVGGVCAVLHGAPISTFDLDVVHARDPGNVDRLIRALGELDAVVRGRASERLTPDRSHLLSAGHQLLMTRFGPLDLLGAIGRDRDHACLLPHSSEIEIQPNLRVRLLGLETLITVKEETLRERDIATLAILRRTLEEKSRE